jgi:LmbE family N-acetylglucosaminyl deacetylase
MKRRQRVRPALPIVLVFAAFCAQAAPRAERLADVVVIAPHPDDEVLLAAGVMARALRAGQHVEVIIVTNGDYTCERDGTVRQAESIAALGALGVPEAAVHFLGYPDGHLSGLTATALPPVERLLPDGRCATGDSTWASRGAHGVDEHTARTGAAAAWTNENLTADLAALLTRLRPRHVYLPHPLDAHPDHAATALYFRRALDRLDVAPEVHQGVVHAKRCWPASDCRTFYAPTTISPVPEVLAGVTPIERLSSDAAAKLTLITHYPSQTGPEPTRDWLASFVRTDELFFPEHLERQGAHWVRAPARNGVELVFGDGQGPTHDGVQVVTTTDEVRLENAATHETLARWPRPAGTMRVRIDPTGASWEWSLFGSAGLAGVAVLPRTSP